MNKIYYRIIWENYPSDKTPLNEQNLNKIDAAADEMDNRIISLDSTKFDKSEAQLLVKYIEYDEKTGIFKITHYNGASYTIDTLLEKLAINFDYDYQTQQLIIELSDGEKKYVDLSALLTQYEFLNSDTVAFTVNGEGKVTADIIEGSIEERHLRPDYLADIKVEVAKAQASQQAAAESEAKAKASEEAAKESEESAAESAAASAGSAASAERSAESASASAADASQKAVEAAGSAAASAESERNAKESETNAESSKTAAAESAANANASAITAGEKATEASNYADEAESYAHGGTGTREGEDTDNAMEYARQAKESAEEAYKVAGGNYVPISSKGVAGGVATLDDSGKVPKSQLPSDIGSVTGVKGNKEATFRTGNVDITPENVGALPLSGGTMDDNAIIKFEQVWFDDKAIEISSDDGASTTIYPEFIRIVGGAGRAGYIQADSADVKRVDTYADEDLIHRNNSGEYPVLDTNNLQKYIQQMDVPFLLPGNIKVGTHVQIWSDNEGGNFRLVAPDGTWWEIDAIDGNLRIFTYANDVKAGITINKLGQVTFQNGAWSNSFYGTLYGAVSAQGGVGGRGTQMSANGFHIDLPPEEGYAGGLVWYQGDSSVEGNAVGCYGYYKQGGYHYVGTNYAAPNGELRTGVIRANNSVYVKYPYALYVRHIEGADGGNLFLNYNQPNIAVAVGDTGNRVGGTGILYVGTRASLWTDTEGGNLSLASPNGVEYQMDAFNDNLRFYRHVGDDYKSAFVILEDGTTDFPFGLIADHICGTTSLPNAISITPNYPGRHSVYNDTTIFIGYYGYGNYLIGPRADNVYDLGWSEGRFKDIYASNPAISTSDENLKRDIIPLDENRTKDFIMGLEPISYIKTNGESGRTHYGLGAQSVERLMEEIGMTSMDFAGLIKSPMYEEYESEEEVEVEKLIPNENGKPIPQTVKEIQKVTKQREIPGEYRYGLRYEEFIAPLIKMVQMQERKIETLTAEIQDLKQMFSNFSGN